MKRIKKDTKETADEISRKEALKKMSTYGKYAALTALGTYAILNPMQAQLGSILDNIGLGTEEGGF
jgi:hypothetical protein